MNDIFVMTCRASNGFGLAVVSAAPGEDPYNYLRGWFRERQFTDPRGQADMYTIEDVQRDCCTYSGILTIGEYWDGTVHVGRKPYTRYD